LDTPFPSFQNEQVIPPDGTLAYRQFDGSMLYVMPDGSSIRRLLAGVQEYFDPEGNLLFTLSAMDVELRTSGFPTNPLLSIPVAPVWGDPFGALDRSLDAFDASN